MKKSLTMIVTLILILMLTACGNGTGSQSDERDTLSQENGNSADKIQTETAGHAEDTSDDLAKEMQEDSILVAYFAYSENMGDTSDMSVDAITSASLNRNTANTEGNLQVMAQEISEKKGADVFPILLQEPFDSDYSTMLGGAIEQIQNGAMPPLQSKVENIGQYNVIFLGIPVWSNEIPLAVRTFLTENDLSGKTIVPFGIHLGSRFGKMIDQIEELCPDAGILEGFTINAETANDEVKEKFGEWLDSLEIE